MTVKQPLIRGESKTYLIISLLLDILFLIFTAINDTVFLSSYTVFSVFGQYP